MWESLVPRSAACAVLVLGCVLGASAARAQSVPGPTGSLQNFRPAPAGDALFGTPSPAAPGHLVPRANVVFDFSYRPLTIQIDDDGVARRFAVVGTQAFLHLNASFALWNRLLITADMPFAVAQSGESPNVDGVVFRSPSSAEVGDLRLGARARLVGENGDLFQLGIGGYVDLPTAGSGGYAGEGAVSGAPQIHFGGRGRYFLWSLVAGPRLRAGTRAHSFDAGAGGAAVLLDDRLQLGLEVLVTQPFESRITAEGTNISVASPTSAEMLFGVKYRPIRALVIGAAAGPGLTNGWGTPVVRAVGMIGYEPPATPPPSERDTDGDRIADVKDACPEKIGAPNADPRKNGCPLDSDGDGIPDTLDACPHMPGPMSADPRRSGCLVLPSEGGDAFSRGRCESEPCVDGTRRELALSYVIRFPRGITEMATLSDAVTEPFAREVMTLLAAHPEIARVEIEGHGDPGGDEKQNASLAEARARAVQVWLTARGIPAAKLVARTGPPSPQPWGISAEERIAGPRVRFFSVTWPAAPR